MKIVIFFGIFVLLSSCVSDRASMKKPKFFLKPNDEVVPIMIQGHVLGEEYDKDSSYSYPLKNVKVLINKASGADGISISAYTNDRGFFSLSPDYILKSDKNKKHYVAIFKKEGYHTVTKILSVPSLKTSGMNVLLKRIK